MTGPSPVRGHLDCRVVVFDLDGVVIDSRAAMRLAFVEAYEAIGGERRPAPFEEFHSYQGMFFPDIVQMMGLPAGMYEAFAAASSRNLAHVEICPGIPALLDRLQQAGIGRAIATGRSHRRAREVLDHLGLTDIFDPICGSDEVEHGKPSPDLLTLVLDRLRISRADAIYVGDSAADRGCAAEARVRFAAATWVDGVDSFIDGIEERSVFSNPSELGEAVLGPHPS